MTDLAALVAELRAPATDIAERNELRARAADVIEGMREALIGNDPELPEYIQPLGWLHSAIQELKDRGPAADCDDPDAYWTMVHEVEQLHDRARAALALPDSKPDGGA